MVRPKLDGIGKVMGSDDEIVQRVLEEAEGRGMKVMLDVGVQLQKEQVAEFYRAHEQRFRAVEFVPGRTVWEKVLEINTQGPVSLVILFDAEGDAPAKWRKIIGATNPTEADPGTIRAVYARDWNNNVVHGSDHPEAVRRDIDWLVGVLESLLE